MPYTTEQIQALSTGYRQGFISVAEAVAMLRDIHDERTGELIVGEPFVVEIERLEYGAFPRLVVERHYYKSEHSADFDGWRECVNCGDWFNIHSDNFPEGMCIEGAMQPLRRVGQQQLRRHAERGLRRCLLQRLLRRAFGLEPLRPLRRMGERYLVRRYEQRHATLVRMVLRRARPQLRGLRRDVQR